MGPLFYNVPLILYDFWVLKLQNKGPTVAFFSCKGIQFHSVDCLFECSDLIRPQEQILGVIDGMN